MVWETVAPLVNWCRAVLMRLLGAAAPQGAIPLAAIDEADKFDGGEDGSLTESDWRYPNA